MSDINEIDGFSQACDPVWEEYLTTGIDPTGGELGPDFNPETGESLENEEEDE